MSRRLPLLAVCLLALGVSALRPQTAPAARPETPRPAPAERPAPPGQSAAAPTMIENALAAVPEDEPRMEAYSHGRYVLFVVGVFWSIAVLLLIVASGIAGRLQRLAERVTTSANRRVAVTVVLFALLTFVAVSAIFFIWVERKVAGRIQDRLGPTRVGGKFGWLQTLADGMKLLVKEDIVPGNADHMLFRMGPYVALAGSFCAFLALPFGFAVVAQFAARPEQAAGEQLKVIG